MREVEALKAELAAVRGNEALDPGVLDSIGAMVVVLDRSGRIVAFNQACEAVTGYSPDEVIGQLGWDTLVRKEDQEKVRSVFSELRSTAAPIRFENDWTTKNGEHRLIAWSNTVRLGDDGEVQFVVATGTDITGHKKLEQALRQGAERLDAILETAIEGIITIDARGIIGSCNKAACELFGYEWGALHGRNVSVLMPEPYSRDHDHYIDCYVQTRVPKIIGIGREVVGIKKDGTIFPIRLGVTEVRVGENVHFTGFIQDLTEQKRHEREAEQWREELEIRVRSRTIELQRANEELELIAYVISHDLRTPLRGIRNYAEFLNEDLGDQLTGESREDLGRLGRAAEELDNMFRDLLSIFQINRKKQTSIAIDSEELINEIVVLIAHQADEEVICVGEFPTLFAPEGMLRPIFQNLIENGLRYNRSEKKQISISCERSADHPDCWIFSFRDNGIGIAAESHEKIFSIFQRLHDDRQFPGTGIGLAVVRRSARRLGGDAWLESAPGKGSTFYVELPERSTASLPDAAGQSGGPSGRFRPGGVEGP